VKPPQCVKRFFVAISILRGVQVSMLPQGTEAVKHTAKLNTAVRMQASRMAALK